MKQKREFESGTTYQVSVAWEFPENQKVGTSDRSQRAIRDSYWALELFA